MLQIRRRERPALGLRPTLVHVIRRTSVALIAVVAGGLLGAFPAAAQTSPHIGVSPTAGPPGTVVTVTGSGFCVSGCTSVTIEFNGQVARSNIAVSPTGSFAVTLTVASGAGTVEVLAEQTKSVQTIQAITYFENTPSTPLSAHPTAHPTTTTTSRPTSAGPSNRPTNTTTPTSPNGSSGSPASALTGASHSDGGPSVVVLALSSLAGALVLGAGGFAARQLYRRRTSG